MSAKKVKPRISADAKYVGEKLDAIATLIAVNAVCKFSPSVAQPANDGIYRPCKYLVAEDGSLYTLEWSHTLDKFNHGDAIQACKGLKLGGHIDWVLPERFELESLLNLKRHNPASDAPDTKSDWYWSATPYASSSDYAWLVYFGNGGVDYNHRYYDGFVRACRRVPARQ